MKEGLVKVSEWLNLKKISLITCVLYVISMLPNLLLAFIARPSGDDYGYSAASRQAWIASHSFFEVIKAGVETTKHMCTIWNGDWFSVFLFTLMPEVFVHGSFWIVPIFWSLAMIGAIYYMLHEILTKHVGIKWYEAGMVAALVLLMSYQWVPSSGVALYWYVGVIHYIMPHVVALFLIGFLFKFTRTYKKRYIVYSALGMIAIGGSSYYSFFLVLFVYVLVFICYLRKEKSIGLFLIPLVIGMIALYYQVKAPGNAARVGGGFGFSIGKAVETIAEALLRGVLVIGEYAKGAPILFVILFFAAIVIWECLSEADLKFEFKYPILWVVYMFGIHAAMFTPEIYAETDISGGPPTMEYFTFVLMAISSIVYVEGWLICKLKKRYELKQEGNYHLYIVIPSILICFIFCILFKGTLKQTLFYESYYYIASGQAADYKEQMDSQSAILLDDSIKEAYLCPTNPEQGPLMHMPVVKDPDAFTNWAVGSFYGKDFVTVED